MIIMEVLRTVFSYLQERATSLQPFLFIAAISRPDASWNAWWRAGDL